MSFPLYFDEDSMDQALIRALRARGIKVTTALEEDMINKKDEEHLEYAARKGFVLFSFNRSDFYQLHSLYLSQGKSHAGIILATQQKYSVGEQMRRILRLAAVKSEKEMKNYVEFLSAWG